MLLPPSGVLGVGSSGGLVSRPCSLRPRALGRAMAWPAAREVQAQVRAQDLNLLQGVKGVHPDELHTALCTCKTLWSTVRSAVWSA